MKYSDGILLLAEEEVPLLSEAGRYYGMKMNVEKTKVKIISRLSSLIQIMIDK